MDVTCCPLSGYDDSDYPSFFSTAIHRAAVPHRCCECREAIARGDRYERVTGKWDGVISTYKTCLSCAEIRDHFACGNGYTFERLWEDLEGNFFPNMTAGGPCMSGLSPAARARLFDRRMAWFAELEPEQREDLLRDHRLQRHYARARGQLPITVTTTATIEIDP